MDKNEGTEGTQGTQEGANGKEGGTGDEALQEAGRKALDEERKLRRQAEKALENATKELEEARKASMTAQERELAEAKELGRKEAADAFRATMAAMAVRAVAAGRLTDPEDAVRFLDLSAVKVADDGTTDTKAISALVDDLLKEKPYLAANVKPAPRPLNGGGSQQGGDAQSPNAWLRQLAGRNA